MSDRKMLYPIGIQSFSEIRENGYVYVDKTALIYHMVKEGKYYFLSRPRRFGKSLLLSTLEAYFLGRRELFDGLAIAGLEKDWIEYPVLHLDLNTEKYTSPEVLDNLLNDYVSQWESVYGRRDEEVSLPLRFQGVIRRAKEKTGRNVVILVDEYDKPMLQAIGNGPLLDAYRATLKSFYGALKSMDACIRFAFLTGVTKFGKVSVFSDLNNLKDISMSSSYYDICGISEEELHGYFDSEIETLGRSNSESKEDAYLHLKQNYDGYHFSYDSPGMYNPFSILWTLSENRYGSYWFETGTPTFLVELLQNRDYNLEKMSRVVTDEDVLNSIFTDDNPIPVIYQSGYLTIKGYDHRFGMYTLGFPNKEVENGFVKFLMPYYTSKDKVDSPFEIRQFVMDVERGDADGFMSRLQSFFANAKFDQIAKDTENWFQNVVFIVTTLAGFYVEAERQTSSGRIDLVIKTDRYIYVIELKYDGSAEEALRQIDEKGYALPFTSDGREIVKIGANFSSALRGIEKWIVVRG
ncbi:MAG: ATP-binding protein [Bacteroidales bacterium]|nr:ATP-binding protein [Bacteroides sp.]MCM1198551.1 ATP-binding protein [Clostridium sp.]MCM1502085.1 ATP-binding protein [Bacteroidales bacterium]